MGLKKARGKKAKRGKARKRQLRLFAKTDKAGHRKVAARHGKAMQKLQEIIDRLLRRQIYWNAKAPVGGRKLRKALRWALANFDVYVTSTNGGAHSPTSYHYRNQAVDIGSDNAAEKARCQKALLKKFGPGYFAELLGPDNEAWVKNGSQYTATEGDALEAQHDDHIHMAIT